MITKRKDDNMLYTIFIIPVLIIIIGYFMYKYPPKKINWVVGYRTRKSMNNEENWKFANQYCGKLWIKTGLIMLAITLVFYTIFYLNVVRYTENILAILVLIQVAIIILPIFIVENKIKNKQ